MCAFPLRILLVAMSNRSVPNIFTNIPSGIAPKPPKPVSSVPNRWVARIIFGQGWQLSVKPGGGSLEPHYSPISLATSLRNRSVSGPFRAHRNSQFWGTLNQLARSFCIRFCQTSSSTRPSSLSLKIFSNPYTNAMLSHCN